MRVVPVASLMYPYRRALLGFFCQPDRMKIIATPKPRISRLFRQSQSSVRLSYACDIGPTRRRVAIFGTLALEVGLWPLKKMNI